MAKAKTVVVNQETCIGCGACVAICPDVFEMGSDGKSRVKKLGNCGKCDCQQAIDSCPVTAISWKK